jgi:predicted transcriptional regulator
MIEIEISSLDIRYEGHRLKDRACEARLLSAIAERGIVEPLEGVDQDERHVLLNGFKRWRCAHKLGITSVPYVSLGDDETTGIIALLRSSSDRALGILEQAGFVDELKRLHGMNVSEIASAVSRSKAWVSLRLGLLAEMPEIVRQKLFAGVFPVYAYMYNLRPFMRINKTRHDDIEQFVVALSGKSLSMRNVEHLAHGYFRGPDVLREQIRQGNFSLHLDALKESKNATPCCSTFEQGMLKDIELARKAMERVSNKCHDSRLSTLAFKSQAQLLLTSILNKAPSFVESVRQLHDRC